MLINTLKRMASIASGRAINQHTKDMLRNRAQFKWAPEWRNGCHERVLYVAAKDEDRPMAIAVGPQAHACIASNGLASIAWSAKALPMSP